MSPVEEGAVKRWTHQVHVVFCGYSRFVPPGPLASVLVPCRATPLSVRARLFTAHKWDVVYVRVVVVWSVRVLHVSAWCPLLAARTTAGRCRVPSASSCPVRARPHRCSLCGPHSSVAASVASITSSVSVLLSSKSTMATAGNHKRMRIQNSNQAIPR